MTQDPKWTMVPVTPSEAMLTAACKVDDEMYASGAQIGASAAQIWAAMIAAASTRPSREWYRRQIMDSLDCEVAAAPSPPAGDGEVDGALEVMRDTMRGLRTNCKANGLDPCRICKAQQRHFDEALSVLRNALAAPALSGDELYWLRDAANSICGPSGNDKHQEVLLSIADRLTPPHSEPTKENNK